MRSNFKTNTLSHHIIMAAKKKAKKATKKTAKKATKKTAKKAAKKR